MKCKTRYDVRLREDPDQLEFIILVPEVCPPDLLQEKLCLFLAGECVLCGREEVNDVVPSFAPVLENADVLSLRLDEEVFDDV